MSSVQDAVAKSPSLAALVHVASEAKHYDTPDLGPTPMSMDTLELAPPKATNYHSPGLQALSAVSMNERATSSRSGRSVLSSISLPPSRSTKTKRKSGGSRSMSSKRSKNTKQVSHPPPRTKADAVGGSSCHQCKSRRTFNDLTYCTSNLDKKKKHCRKKYCDHCLKKFYKESAAEIKNKNTWRCPSCRRICCCAACRRKELRLSGQLPPDPAPPMYSSQQRLANSKAAAAASNGGIPGEMEGLETLIAGAHGPVSPADMYHYVHSSANQDASSFHQLFNVAQMPSVKKHIQYILSRKDITDAQKVECIASLLRGAVAETGRTVRSSRGTLDAATTHQLAAQQQHHLTPASQHNMALQQQRHQQAASTYTTVKTDVTSMNTQ